MKFLFKVVLIIFFSTSLFSKNIESKYKVKTKGINIGELLWKYNSNKKTYSIYIELQSTGLLSKLYKFKGKYSSHGYIINEKLIPNNYKQDWDTKNKKRVVEIIFKDQKIKRLSMMPIEKEVERINIRDLKYLTDPITSFTNILINPVPQKTIDGRRLYTLFPEKIESHLKIYINEFANIWADHKRNDLEYLEVYYSQNDILPKRINIKFKGTIFILSKI